MKDKAAGKTVKQPDSVSQTQVESVANSEFDQKAAGCAGKPIKLQVLYHCDPKTLIGDPKSVPWEQFESAIALFDHVDKSGKAVTKVYLAACDSTSTHPEAIKGALDIRTVKNVITAGGIILLNEGDMDGATYPTFQPTGLDVSIWDKPDKPLDPPIHCDEDEKFDILTNRCVPRT